VERREQSQSRRPPMATLRDLSSAPVLLALGTALRTVWRGWRLSNSMRLELLLKRLASPTRLEDPNSDRGERPRLE
jgi:hypothetical protein